MRVLYDDSKVAIHIGGGLGDTVMVYLANPKSHFEDGDNNYPTTNHQASIWFRRLASFKKKHPDVHVKLIITTHNKNSMELFETNPYIDSISMWDWDITNRGMQSLWSVPSGMEYDPTKQYEGKQESFEYTPIFWLYDYLDYEVEEPYIYLKEEDGSIYEFDDLEYVVMHPFAAYPRNVLSINKYIEVADRLYDYGLKSVFVGASYVRDDKNSEDSIVIEQDDVIKQAEESKDYIINLVNKASARLSVTLSMSAKGFVGTHSSMCMSAWYAGWKRNMPTSVIIPNIPHFRRIKETPVGWGFNKEFNQTNIINNYYEAEHFDPEAVADFIGSRR